MFVYMCARRRIYSVVRWIYTHPSYGRKDEETARQASRTLPQTSRAVSLCDSRIDARLLDMRVCLCVCVSVCVFECVSWGHTYVSIFFRRRATRGAKRARTSGPISKRMIVHYHFNNMRNLCAKYASSDFQQRRQLRDTLYIST